MNNYLMGLDVSNAQSKIDWQKVKDSNLVDYAFAKASEGSTYKDTWFDTNWKAIKDIGLIRGGYHFARTNNDPIAEATHFCSVLTDLQETDMLVLDIETGNVAGTAFINWVLSWCETVTKLTNKYPIIYTGGPFWKSHEGSVDKDTGIKLSTYPLWLAAYTNDPTIYVPLEWKDIKWTFWQASGSIGSSMNQPLHVPGINGAVDRDYYDGSLDDLIIFAKSLNKDEATSEPNEL